MALERAEGDRGAARVSDSDRNGLTEYETADKFHYRIEALYPAVDRHRAWFRGLTEPRARIASIHHAASMHWAEGERRVMTGGE